MRAFSLGISLAAALVSMPAIAADSAEETAALETKTCVPLTQIRQTKVINDETIVFIMRGSNRYYRNDLPNRCPRLKFNNGFSYATSISQLCNVDIITVLENIGGRLTRGAACGLGKFEPISKDQFAALKDEEKAKRKARKAKKNEETSR